MPIKNFRHVRKSSVIKKPDGGKIKLGSYRPDKKNPNDKTYQSNRFSAESLPPKVDLRPCMTTVENQGNSNSCTANAMAGAYEYLANRLKGTSDDVSRLFIYYNARDLDGDPDKDEGTYLRSCIKVLKKYGTCSEKTWPFDLHRIFEVPHNDAYDEASNFLVEDAYRVDLDLDKMRSCLAEGYPFTFGLELFSSFQKAGANGLIPMPDADAEQHDGGHAMLCVGYSDADKVFIVRNSWGDDWGDRGYCYIPYDYMTNSDLNGDLWTIRSVSGSDVDLSKGVHGNQESLFDSATAAIANALQVAGAINTEAFTSEYTNEYAVEYESQSVYVEGQGFISADVFDAFESLYYQEYEEEYEEYTVTEESEEPEYSDDESEDVEDSYEESEDKSEEESEEIEDSYEDKSEEESESDYEDESEDDYEEESEEESNDIEDSYEDEEDSYEDEEDSYEDEEDSYEDDYEEDSEDTEASYEDETGYEDAEEDYGDEEE